LINNQSLVIRIDNTEEVTKKTEQLSSLNSASSKKFSVNNMATANQNDNGMELGEEYTKNINTDKPLS